ncbi:MAG: hypothetical protein V4592_26530 [Bacteroidota bacterium]
MKKSLLFFWIIVLTICKVFAQASVGTPRTESPVIIYNLDTTVYLPDTYKVAQNSKVAQILKAIGDFEIDGDSSIVHWGQRVHKFAINGKTYTASDMVKVLKMLPADVVENIESVIDYNKSGIISIKTPEIDELININIKKDQITYVNNLLAIQQISQPNNRAQSINDLIKKLPGIDVGTDGNLTYNGKPVTKMRLHDVDDSQNDTLRLAKLYPLYAIAIPKITKIVLNCRDYITEAVSQITLNMNAGSDPDIDDYGDQVPHFIITPSPGSWISKASRY